MSTIPEVPRSLHEQSVPSGGLVLSVDRFPFVKGLEDEAIHDTLAQFQQWHDEGQLEIDTQVISINGSHNLEIYFRHQEEAEDEETSIHFFSFPVDNPDGKLHGRAVANFYESVRSVSGDPVTAGLTEAIFNKIEKEHLDRISVSRAKNTAIVEAEIDSGITSPNVLMAIDKMLQQSLQSEEGTAVNRLREKFFEALVDHSEEVAALSTALRINDAVKQLGLAHILPEDPLERFDMLGRIMDTVNGMRERTENSQALQSYYHTQQEFYHGLGDASRNWFRKMIASPEVRAALGPALEMAGVRLMLDVMPENMAEKLPTAQQALEIAAESKKKLRLIGALAAEESLKARHRANAARKEEERLANARSRIEEPKAEKEERLRKAEVREREAQASQHEAEAQKVRIEKTLGALIDSFWRIPEKGGEKVVGPAFRWAGRSAKAVWKTFVDTDDGAVVNIFRLAGAAGSEVIEWVGEHKGEAAGFVLGASSGFVMGSAASTYLVEAGWLTQPWMANTTLGLITASGVTIGTGIAVKIKDRHSGVKNNSSPKGNFSRPNIYEPRRPPTPIRPPVMPVKRPLSASRSPDAEPTYHPISERNPQEVLDEILNRKQE